MRRRLQILLIILFVGALGVQPASAMNPIQFLKACLSPFSGYKQLEKTIRAVVSKRQYPEELVSMYNGLGMNEQAVNSRITAYLGKAANIIKRYPSERKLRSATKNMDPYGKIFLLHASFFGLDPILIEKKIVAEIDSFRGNHDFFMLRPFLSKDNWEKLLSSLDTVILLKYLPYLKSTGDLESKLMQDRLANIDSKSLRFISMSLLPIASLPTEKQKRDMGLRVKGSTISSADWELKLLPRGTCHSAGCEDMQIQHLGGIGYEPDYESEMYLGDFIPVYYKGEIMGSIKTNNDRTFLAWKTLPSKRTGGYSLVAGAAYMVPLELQNIAKSKERPERIELNDIGLPTHFTPLKFMMGSTYWREHHAKLLLHLNKLISSYE